MVEKAAPVPSGATSLQKPPGYRDPAARPPMGPRPPPRKTNLPPVFRQAGKPLRRNRRRWGRHCCRHLCCWIILFIIIAAVVIAAAAGLAYLWYQPRFPSFKIQSIQPSKFKITSKPDGSYLDSTASLRLLAWNPNSKLALDYSSMDASVYISDDDGDIAAGSASAAGFVQGKRNSTLIRMDTAVGGVMMDDAVASRLKSRFKSKELKFSVDARTKLGVKVGGKSTGWKVPIRVECGAVSLKQLRRGGAAVPKCEINVLRWINLH